MHARLVRCAMTGLMLVTSAGVLVSGCLTRPVVPGEPVTKTNFTTKVQEQTVDKLDLLFSIDNSASMGDKQAFLVQAIPDLINRLVTPNCVDITTPTTVYGPSAPGANGVATCSYPNSQLEFPPVHDMHIGIVSSSLGPRLGDQVGKKTGGACIGSATTTIGGVQVPDHNDDQAHLLSRSSTSPTSTTETALPDASNGFLAWYPPPPANTGAATTSPVVTSSTTLATDFGELVAGVHQYGCGIESQLENWYRFLVQPDPYASLGLDANNHAVWVGVDTTILQQRHDFLRPDSLVAVVVLSDENDSEIDVRSIGGQGYLFMSTEFTPPHGTSGCAGNPTPTDPAKCTVCSGSTASDPACAAGPYTAPTDWGYDLNLRHVHMQAKYGINPQFPISRYVVGLTSSVVPDRNGEYPAGAANYVGNNNCTNPLYAASLPDGTGLTGAGGFSAADEMKLCNLTAGTRQSSLVFYAHIGGVPNQLLHFDPASANNSLLTDADWVSILGNDPDNYDYTGIDPHMIESYQPRNVGGPGAPTYNTASPITGETPLAAATSPNGTDPWNGREWVTNVGTHVDLSVDREYACIFQLVDPQTGAPTPRDCTQPDNKFACDCSSTTLTHDQTSPVCDETTPTTQKYAKAYPTIRELNLAHKMGKQGIVSSICPIHVTDQMGGSDPLFGYRPAVATIVDRLKNALTNTCLPQQLTPDPTKKNAVPCLILATLPTAGNQSVCTSTPGLGVPDPAILAQFRASQEAAWKANGGTKGGAGPDPNTLPVCEVTQLLPGVDYSGTCKTSTTNNKSGWCYVQGMAAGSCPQAILFTNGTPPTGSTISLQCIENSQIGADGG